MCKYCIFTMDWTSRISYVHIGQYYYYYIIIINRTVSHKSCHKLAITAVHKHIQDTITDLANYVHQLTA